VSHFYTRTSTPATKISYIEDPSELIPAVSKTAKRASLDIGLADAKPVNIVSKSAHYTFQTPELPKIQFQGSLIVSNIEDDTDPIPAEKRTIHPKSVLNQNTENKSKNIDSSPVSVSVVAATVQQSKMKGKPLTVNGEQARTSVSLVEEKPSSSSALYFTVTVMSFAVVLLFLGLEAHISVVDQTVTTSYGFDIDNLTASAYASIADAKNFFSLIEFSTNFFIL
jgi:hypothetical protein